MISSSSIQRKPASPQICTGGTYGAALVAPFLIQWLLPLNAGIGVGSPRSTPSQQPPFKYIFLPAKALVK